MEKQGPCDIKSWYMLNIILEVYIWKSILYVILLSMYGKIKQHHTLISNAFFLKKLYYTYNNLSGTPSHECAILSESVDIAFFWCRLPTQFLSLKKITVKKS